MTKFKNFKYLKKIIKKMYNLYKNNSSMKKKE